MNSNDASPTKRFVAGVDGGGSKTVAFVADSSGRVLGRGMASASNYQSIGFEAAAAAIYQALTLALAQAAQTLSEVQVVCLGLAGVARPEDQRRFAVWLEEAAPATKRVIVNDAEAVLAAGTPAGHGIALICGTGAIAIGRTAQDKQARADGWGPLLGDAGSGYDIGRSALRAVAGAADGRAPATLLTTLLLEHWSLAAPQEMIKRVYQQEVSTREVAALSRLVTTAAGQGDEAASAIVRHAGEELAQSVQAVAQTLHWRDPIPCALAGGVIVHSAELRQVFLSEAHRLGLRLQPVQLVEEPVYGALKIARQALENQR
jgi:N-acetylglucosamine kinase-like BadF-type ATPase